jgi:hypothetical protein
VNGILELFFQELYKGDKNLLRLFCRTMHQKHVTLYRPFLSANGLTRIRGSLLSVDMNVCNVRLGGRRNLRQTSSRSNPHIVEAQQIEI